ncbi:MAG: imidazole glycerol phosphate synthase cyclase subunit [Pseudomonadota bacterium]
MNPVRLIARLDIKGENLIKGIQLEGLRVIGNPQEYATGYYNDGIDELIFMDTVASLYGRNNLARIVEYTSENIFVPLTVGGGIRSLADVEEMLRAGADKVAINTAAINNPKLISEVAKTFGAQCMVLSIEAKARGKGEWEVYTDNGRERSGKSVVQWAKQVAEMGAGEILLTSVDCEGTRRGFDVALVKAVTDAVSVPVIASGGMGKVQHLVEVVQQGKASAVAMADILHYRRAALPDIRTEADKAGIKIRMPEREN